MLGKREPEIYGSVSFEDYLPQLRDAHTSIALADCIRAIDTPVVEVHISDITKREPFRRHSYTAEACEKVFMGLGLKGYEEAITALTKTPPHQGR